MHRQSQLQMNPNNSTSADQGQVIEPGSTIGIFGGGQLGRMAAMAAAQLGYATHIYSPESRSPAAQVADQVTVASYENQRALQDFAESVDVITFEFENVPAESIQFVEGICPVRPRWHVLEISQNRLREKRFLNDKAGVGTAPFTPVTSLNHLKSGFAELGGEKAILKTSELGYDGKGQFVIDAETDLDALWQEANMREGVLEGFVPFKGELSVIIARNHHGEVACYPPAKNTHVSGILDVSEVPAAYSQAVLDEATAQTLKIAEALQLRGLLAVEFFVTEDDELLVNEMAPRPHNSGHWTMDGAYTSQFEQFIRAVCGLPLGSVETHSDVLMKNLIGKDVNDWPELVKDASARLHLYGKKEARDGRKMGHVNYVSESK